MNSTLEAPEPRIALVTGASRGVGRAVALALAAEGVHIVALARTQGGLEELDDAIRALRPGDEGVATPGPVRSQGTARRSIGWERALFRRWGRLDVLVGNAGVLEPPVAAAPRRPCQWEDVMSVNVTANWRLIRSLDPLLRESKAGRVVFVTSGAASRAELRALLGPLCRLEGRARRPRPDLCGGDRDEPRKSASCSSIRALCERAAARRRHAGRRSTTCTLRTPEDLAPKILELCSPDWRETGKLYDFPADRVFELLRADVGAATPPRSWAAGWCNPSPLAGEGRERSAGG